jgi:hypothetical protein
VPHRVRHHEQRDERYDYEYSPLHVLTADKKARDCTATAKMYRKHNEYQVR